MIQSLKRTPAAEIVLYQSVKTRFGYLVWDPNKVGLALVAAAVGGFLGLVGGAYLGLELDNRLGSALLSLCCSTVGTVLAALNTLRV